MEQAAARTDRHFLEELSLANSGIGTWEPGWTVVGIAGDGRYAVSKGPVRFWVYATGMRSHEQKPGFRSSCRVWVTKEKRHLVPGFYYFVGDSEEPDLPPDDGRNRALLRIYWNISADGGSTWVEAVSRIFNETSIPFNAKLLSDPNGYNRADAG